MKKHVTLFLSLLAILIFAPTVYAADFTLWINGSNPALEEDAPYLKNDRVMVPLRLISENFGYDVNWQSSTRSIIMHPANKKISGQPSFSLKINDHNIYANGIHFTMTDVAPEIKNDYTYVPLRVIAELFGYPVRWNPLERSAIIGYEEPVPYIDRYSVKRVDFVHNGVSLGKLSSFAENGQIYVRADQLAKALGMSYHKKSMIFSDDPDDLMIVLQSKDGFSITFDSRYVTSSDGLNFGRHDMNTYKIVDGQVFIPLARYVDAKHMKLSFQSNLISLTTDPTPTAYPITIMKYLSDTTTHFSPTKTKLFIYWNGTRYVIKDHLSKDISFGHYIDYLYSEDGYRQLEGLSDENKSELRFGDNNHFYLQRQAGMVIGGMSD